MRGSGVGRSNNRPLRIEPRVGKVSEYSVEAQGKVPSDVLGDQAPRSHLANHAKDFGPEVAGVLFGVPLPGNAERLAGVSSGDDIDSTHERSEVEVTDIAAPNRRRLQARAFHPLQKDGRRVGVPLTEGQNSGSEHGVNSKVEAPDS